MFCDNGSLDAVLPGLRDYVVFAERVPTPAGAHPDPGPTGVVQGRYQGLQRGQGHQHDNVVEEWNGLLRRHP